MPDKTCLPSEVGPWATFAPDHKNIQNSPKYVGNRLQYSAVSAQNTFLILLPLLNYFSLEIFLALMQAK